MNYYSLPLALVLAVALGVLVRARADEMAAPAAKCVVCGTELKPGASYLSSGGKAYCGQTCLAQTLPKCVVCGQPVLNGLVGADGKSYYCSAACLQTTYPPCAICGKKNRDGSYIATGDKVYCSPECHRKSCPKCAVCGQPVVKGLTSKDGRKFFCSTQCLETTYDTCTHCGKKTNGGTHFNGDRTRIFCRTCGELTKCFNCGLPDECLSLDDHRPICQACKRTAIMDLAAAQSLLNEVRKTMRDKLAIGTESDIQLALVSNKQLNKTTRWAPQDSPELGRYQYTATTNTIRYTTTGKPDDVKVTIKETHEIQLLYGMSRSKFMEVAAHELAHQWMQIQYPGIQDTKIKEGWAEYTASRVNSLYQFDLQNLRLEGNDNPIYGDGFRMIRSLAETKGKRGLLEFLHASNDAHR
ncbi:MAG: hypothetical protein WCO56_18985 [Verrucomicrobiota bacterium]